MPNKVLAMGMSWTARDQDWKFNLGGIVGDESDDHFAFDLPDLNVGDKVSLQIVETEAIDTPDHIYHPAKKPRQR